MPGSPSNATKDSHRESQAPSPVHSPSNRPSSALSPSHRAQSLSPSRMSQSLPPPYVQAIEDSERVQLCPSMAAGDDPPPLRPRSATSEPSHRHISRRTHPRQCHAALDPSQTLKTCPCGPVSFAWCGDVVSNISTTGTLQLDDDVRLVSGRTGLPSHKASSPPSRPSTHGGHRPRDEEEEKFIQELRRLQGETQRSPKGGGSDSLGLSTSGSAAKRPPSAVFNRTPRFSDKYGHTHTTNSHPL